jgi:hypothetical protein
VAAPRSLPSRRPGEDDPKAAEIVMPAGGQDVRGRTILVLEEQPYLWAALRQHVDPTLAYVRSASSGDLARVWRTCQPWPWLLAGTGGEQPAGLLELIGSHPIPIHWVGTPPAGLLGLSIAHRDWTGLVGALDEIGLLAEHGFNGVTLMRNRGLLAPDGRIVLHVSHVEGLLAAPAGLVLPTGKSAERAAAAATDEITAGGLPLVVERDGDRLRLVHGAVPGEGGETSDWARRTPPA